MNTKIFSFQGMHGAYSELAGKNIYPDSKSIPCKTFEEMFESVRDKKANIAIVPIENSRSGRVGDTQRLIPESQLKIVGEYFLEVNHCLMGVPGSTLKDIKRIYSHEQGIAQCRKKIINNKKDMVIVADTAGAAKMISETNSKEDAAIASNLAAKIYNLDILESNFQDFENNVTRFLIMSNELNIPKVNEIDLMTTLVFEVRSIPAALYKSLGGLASNGVNMTKLESYINPQGFDVAQFYMDIEGHPNNRNVKLALEEMKFFCKHIDILGVYKMSDFRKK
ncbi:MAG: P-protein [Alphaproteobacteria bacterium MarineAlpha5_Bin2]|jgi:prephenate dehydratase|nr:MAG: P-protein [Alphaproteobacteria bacterium MarineAlpha5_Bin2]HIA60384.1 prephenate dehydratase [Pelagibacterales bacterium]|tara:strand:+ start:586 stop:1425 length:840 start_codon:yes stop_codon:yes gene_type:complete